MKRKKPLKNNFHTEETNLELKLEEMEPEDISRVVELVSSSMNENEGRWAKETIDFHYFCKAHDKDDGRAYYVAKKDDYILGICGWHRYIWGPENRVWLGWFAVDPEFQRKGIGHEMMEKICKTASKKGFKKMFIETYSDDDFLKARNFYEKFGFEEAGRIESYIKEGVDMVVYSRDL